MKKITSILLAMACGVGFNAAQAEVVAVGTQITPTECEVLDENVSPSLSRNVAAAYSCDPDFNLIKVGACHESGRKKVEEVACVQVGEWNDTVVWNGTCAQPTDKVDIAATGKGFVSTNAGGSAAAVDLGAACGLDGATINTVVEALGS